MEDREFFDTIYQAWARTTRAEDTYWIVEEDTEYVDSGPGTWLVWAMPEEGERIFIASFEKEEDADFVASMHGCLSDLVRRLHAALDESDRLDEARDLAENALAEESLINLELQQQLAEKS